MSVTTACAYPRVLVVDATPFCRHMNNGIVKSNLFQGWPKSGLAQIMYANVQPGFDVCERYWTLRKTSILLGAIGVAPDSALCRSAGQCAGTIYDPERAHTFESRPGMERMFAGLSKAIRQPVGETILRLPSVFSRRLSEWIERFAPEVVFTLGGNAAVLRIAAKLAERRRIPLMPYFTDDWVSCIYEGDLFGHVLRPSFVHWFQRTLALSPIRLTASDAMSREYKRRYGGRFETFMNSSEVFETTAEPVLPTVRFSFIGALSPNRWRPLLLIGMALAKLRARGLSGELVIYTLPEDIRQFGKGLAGCDAIRVAGTARADEVRRIQLEANVLVHAESFDESTRRLTRLSLSTKIPQYLMGGRCVLAYGPPELASVRYISESGAGMAVSTEDVDELASELERLVSSPALRQAYAVRARQTALDRHDAVGERERFRNLICASVQSGSVGDGDKAAGRDERVR
jgi:glycosyltransferase involved in cell wall biosynthesis